MASLSNGALARVAASLVSCEGAAKDPTPAPVTAAPTIEWSRANLDELKQLLPMSLAKIRLSAGGVSYAVVPKSAAVSVPTGPALAA